MPQPENIKKNCFYQVIIITTINICHFAQFKPIQWESTNYYKTWSNISSIRGSVSSPHETLRRQLKIWLQWSIFDELWGVSSGDETLWYACYYFSYKIILDGEIKDAKMSSSSSDFQTLIKH